MPRDLSSAHDVVLGDYLLLEELGSGTYSVAYLARCLKTGRKAVAKIAHPYLVQNQTEEMIRARFKIEFEALMRLDHPNMVRGYASGETLRGLPVLVMEYVDGVSLETMLRAQVQLPLSAMGPIFTQLGEALIAVHDAGVIHRDVTPTNVMMALDEYSRPLVKLLDFGIAKLDRTGAMFTDGPIGTPYYLAPEQIIGEPTTASDMFSMGAIMWRALTGYEVLGHVQSVSHYLAAAQLMTEAPDPRKIRADIHPELVRMVRSLLEPEPERRPTARVFVEQWSMLMRLLRSSRSRATRAPWRPARVLTPETAINPALDTFTMHQTPGHGTPTVTGPQTSNMSGIKEKIRDMSEDPLLNPRAEASRPRELPQAPSRTPDTSFAHRSPSGLFAVTELSTPSASAPAMQTFAKRQRSSGRILRPQSSPQLIPSPKVTRGRALFIARQSSKTPEFIRRLCQQGLTIERASDLPQRSAELDTNPPDMILIAANLPVFRLGALASHLNQRARSSHKKTTTPWYVLVVYDTLPSDEIVRCFDLSLPVDSTSEELELFVSSLLD